MPITPRNVLFENLIIINKKKEGAVKKFLKEIDWLHDSSLSIFFNILKAVKNKWETIVIEKEYVDADYLDTYSRYYASLFADYRNKCWRLHFFENEINFE